MHGQKILLKNLVERGGHKCCLSLTISFSLFRASLSRSPVHSCMPLSYADFDAKIAPGLFSSNNYTSFVLERVKLIKGGNTLRELRDDDEFQQFHLLTMLNDFKADGFDVIPILSDKNDVIDKCMSASGFDGILKEFGKILLSNLKDGSQQDADDFVAGLDGDTCCLFVGPDAPVATASKKRKSSDEPEVVSFGALFLLCCFFYLYVVECVYYYFIRMV